MGDLDAETLKWVCAAHSDGVLRDCYPGTAALQLDALITGLALWPQVTMRRGTLAPKEQRQVCSEIVDMFMARYAPGELASARSRKGVEKVAAKV